MLKKLGKAVSLISVFEALGSFVMVTIVVTFITGHLWMGLIFGGLSCATAPAATIDVLREYNASGPLTSTTFAIVGIDDALALIIYSFAAGFAEMLFIGGKSLSVFNLAIKPIIHIIGSISIGIAVGIGLAFAVKRIHERNSLLLLTYGSIIATCGFANYLEWSYILAAMGLGITVINLPFGRKKPFNLVNDTKMPIYILFFIFTGARLRIGLLLQIGLIGIAYILFRTVGKGGGSWLATRVAEAKGLIEKEDAESLKKYFWLCLFSQAGVAIGLAIEAMHTFQAYGAVGEAFASKVITIIAGTTLFFQVIGPPAIKVAIDKAGEITRGENTK